MSEYLEVNNVTRKFGSLTAVDNVSFNLSKGQVLGFLGPNGAGKTTTMRIITGYIEPTSGSVSVCGYDVSDEPIRSKEQIGYLPEGVPLYPEMTPRLFLNFIGGARRLESKDLEQKLSFVINKLGLKPVLDQSIETLSKGYKRRVAFAQAILHDPKVLILDEPTDGLDPIQKLEVRKLIRDMASDKAIIISTHILEEVTAVCDRVIIISEGNVITDETPSTLIQKDKYHNAVQVDIKNPDFTAVKEDLQKLPYVGGVEKSYDSREENTLLILSQNSSDISRQIIQFIHEKNWDYGSLSVKSGDMEEVFRKLTLGKNENRIGAEIK